MNVIIHLGWKHDLDLIMLAEIPSYHLGIWMRDALCAYVRHQKLVIPLPDMTEYPNNLTNTSVSFFLKEQENPDVCAFLENVRYGFRGSLVKQIFRNALVAPFVYPMMDTSLRVFNRDNKEVILKTSPSGQTGPRYKTNETRSPETPYVPARQTQYVPPQSNPSYIYEERQTPQRQMDDPYGRAYTSVPQNQANVKTQTPVSQYPVQPQYYHREETSVQEHNRRNPSVQPATYTNTEESSASAEPQANSVFSILGGEFE